MARPTASLKAGAPGSANRVRGAGVVQFVRESYGELKKVVWPTREQATRLTVLVLALSSAMGVVFVLIDVVFQRVLNITLF